MSHTADAMPRSSTSNDADARAARFDTEQFVAQVQSRLNRNELLRCLLGCLIVASAILMVAGLIYILQGFRFPLLWYPAVLGTAWLAALVAWTLRRSGPRRAARVADQQFGLKDSVSSAQNFSADGKFGGFYELQARQTQNRLAEFDPQRLPLPSLTGLVWPAVITTLLAVAIGFKGPSQSYLDRLDREQVLLASTAEANEEIRELVDELERELAGDDSERELIDPDKLREWVSQLEETPDQRQAMRQYAKLEQIINKAADELKTRREEELLNRAAHELEKDERNRDLGELLKQKKYEQAAKALEKLDPTQPNDKETDPKRKLTEQQKKLAKLRAAAQRMAMAARQSADRDRHQRGNDRDSQNPDSSDGNKSRNRSADSPSGKQGAASGQKSTSDGSSEDVQGEAWDSDEDIEAMDAEELTELLEELEETTREMEEAMERAKQSGDPSDEECEACQAALGEKLDELGETLRKLARKRSARNRLQALSRKIGQLQSGVRSRAAAGASKGALIPTSNPGGKEAGTGSSDRQREDADNPESDGPSVGLKGIKGEGPSLTQVQSADSGTGTSTRNGEATERQFSRQFESFVQREDIPESLKSGVREYFLQIHRPPVEDPQPMRDDNQENPE